MKYWRKPLDLDRVKLPRGEVHVIEHRCKGCGFCAEYCPKDVLEMSEEYNAKGYHYPRLTADGVCINCGLCELICPDFAIYTTAIERGEEEQEPASAAGAAR